MFQSLSNRFKDVFNFIAKKASITEKDLDEVLREIRLVLLEADVSLEVIRYLLPKLKEDLINKEIYRSISPKQFILKALHDSIVDLLSDKNDESALYTRPTTFVMMVGLQGTGKTTTSAKIANYAKNKLQKKVLLVGLDLSRLAAYEQLQTLAKDNNLDFFEHKRLSISNILEEVKSFANKNFYDLVILDTAGRLSIDEELMDELKYVYAKTKAKEVLLVLDSMTGQISLDVAKRFKETIPLSGAVISKADADIRGGSILSCKFITGVPIKFMGVGEKVGQIETFIPKRIADRILDQGDIISLIEKFDDIQEEEDSKLEERMMQGLFSLEDFKSQLLKMQKLGGMSSLMGMIPGISAVKDKISQGGFNEDIIKKNVAIINSMTIKERKKTSILNFSRKKRIAQGSGTTLQDINVLLKQFAGMEKMMKQMKSMGGPLKMMKSLGMNPFVKK